MEFVHHFATTHAAMWLWSAPPLHSTRAKPHENNTKPARPPSIGLLRCTQAPGIPHAGRTGHVATFDPNPTRYQRPRCISLAQLVRHITPFDVAVVSSASARAKPPKQHTKPAAASQPAIDRAVAPNASPWAPGRLSSWSCSVLALCKGASFGFE